MTDERKAQRAEEVESDVAELLDAAEQGDSNAGDVAEQIHAAAAAEAGVDDDLAYGRPGPRFDRRSPFFIGMGGAAGVAIVFAVGSVIVAVGQELLLIALAIIFAVGLEPGVNLVKRTGLPRWAAVVIVLVFSLGVFAGFLALAIPVLVNEATKLADEVPTYLHSLNNHHTFLGKLNTRYHIVSAIQKFISKGGSSEIAGGVLGVGKVVLDLVGSVVLVVILSVYMLADLPRIKRGLYRLAPKSRRARMVLLTDEVLARIGGYVLGNLLTSFIAGLGTWVWALAFGIPYALLLGFMVALLDLIPVVGSTIGGIIVALIALTQSLPIAIATALFYVLYRFLEDYLLTPKIMARTVQVPGLLTVIATLIGGTLFGIIGALIAIPVAATIKLLLEETTLRQLETR
ncbi:MAG TPA: AI-2E family transporter [Solirubrobacteraceae bacterium]|jgi:predicted PurR-regulated permease PerM|nr:AI-2E family transporter [Solirubrobacteraceae bacterium]